MKKAYLFFLMIFLLTNLKAQQEKVHLQNGKLYQDTRPITRKDYKKLIKNNEEAFSYFKKQNTANAFAYPLAFIGGFGLGFGGTSLLLNKNSSLTPTYAAIMGGGIAITATAFIIEAVGRGSLKKSIKAYNGNSQNVSFQLKSSSNEIGLVAQF